MINSKSLEVVYFQFSQAKFTYPLKIKPTQITS